MNENETSVSPIAIACQRGDFDMFRLLAESGANVSAVNRQGNTLLHTACANGRADIAKHLLDQKGDANTTHPSGLQPGDRVVLDGSQDFKRAFEDIGQKYTPADAELVGSEGQVVLVEPVAAALAGHAMLPVEVKHGLVAAGAGNEALNGVFSRSGSKNGASTYTKGGYSISRNSSGCWGIYLDGDSDADCYYFKWGHERDKEPPVSGWDVHSSRKEYAPAPALMFAQAKGSSSTASRHSPVPLTADSAEIGQRVVHSGDRGEGVLLGWKKDGTRHGDTSGGLESDNFCRVQFDGGSGWNLSMSECNIISGGKGANAGSFQITAAGDESGFIGTYVKQDSSNEDHPWFKIDSGGEHRLFWTSDRWYLGKEDNFSTALFQAKEKSQDRDPPLDDAMWEERGSRGGPLAFGVISHDSAATGALTPVSAMILEHPSHEHPVKLNSRNSGWYCDVCRENGEGNKDGATRWRCTRGCDWDACGDCMAHLIAGAQASEARAFAEAEAERSGTKTAHQVSEWKVTVVMDDDAKTTRQFPITMLMLTQSHPNPLLFLTCSTGSNSGDRDATAKLLIKSKADVGATTENGAQLLRLACKNGLTEVVKLLVAAKAELQEAYTDDVSEGCAPVLLASAQGNADMVKALLGGDVAASHKEASRWHATGLCPGDHVTVNDHSGEFEQAFVDVPCVTKWSAFEEFTNHSKRRGTISEGGKVLTGQGDWFWCRGPTIPKDSDSTFTYSVKISKVSSTSDLFFGFGQYTSFHPRRLLSSFLCCGSQWGKKTHCAISPTLPRTHH